MNDEVHNVTDLSRTPEERQLVAGIRQQLDRSCNALDGHTLSRLNRIRHAALERKQSRTSRMLLPFGGFVTACVLVVSVMLFTPGTAPETDAVASPLEDIDILTSSDSLDLYEDYEFYQWLAENDSQV
jgi:hypothetical protein